jgi:hypothetical protein
LPELTRPWQADKLGISMYTGATLILIWAAVLGAVIGVRRSISYVDAKPLFWFETFFRTGEWHVL